MHQTLLPDQHYFSIGEVSQITQVKPYILRYWETQFGRLKPPRRDSGQRKFTQKEIDLILRIKDLLYTKGYTVSGAKKLLIAEWRQEQRQLKLALGESALPPLPRETLKKLRHELEEIQRLLVGKAN